MIEEYDNSWYMDELPIEDKKSSMEFSQYIAGFEGDIKDVEKFDAEYDKWVAGKQSIIIAYVNALELIGV